MSNTMFDAREVLIPGSMYDRCKLKYFITIRNVSVTVADIVISNGPHENSSLYS